jgi:hypothetical protein
MCYFLNLNSDQNLLLPCVHDIMLESLSLIKTDVLRNE